MKVRIRDIPARGLELKARMELCSFNKRLNDGSGGNKGFVFSEAPNVDLLIHKTSHGGLVNGTIKGKYRQSCALCLDEVERELNLKVDFMLRERPEGISEDHEQYQDDVGIFHFNGDQVDLERIVEEFVLLSLEVYWHPPLEDNGSCTYCKRKFLEEDGKETHSSQTFGDLLKKAGGADIKRSTK